MARMKIGKIYVQNQTGQDLYFRPTGQTNTGVKGILYTVYHGRKTKGKNPKKDSVPDSFMDLWSDATNVPSDVENKLKENKMSTITRSRINEIIKEEYQKLIESKYIEIDKPTEVSSAKVKKEIEKLAKSGTRSKDILLKMNFTTANTKQVTDKFQVLKNKVYFALKESKKLKEGMPIIMK